MTDYSQNGEQQLIDEVFPDLTDGWAVDVGASDGVSLSNTKSLEDKGWHVLCLEPNPLYFERLTSRRKRVLPVACDDHNRDFVPFVVIQTPGRRMDAGSALAPRWELFPLVGVPEIDQSQIVPVAVRTLDWCLEHMGYPHLDFLSIDTEGNELNVLKGFDIKRWQPKLVVIENWVDAPAIRDYFEGVGYRRKARLQFNDLYVRNE